MPVIVGHENKTTLDLMAGTPITLTCRADYGDPPFLLTWTNQLELKEETTAVDVTTAINIVSTDELELSNDTTKEAVTQEPTSMDASTTDNEYFTTSTERSTPANTTVFGNGTWLKNSDINKRSASINETPRVNDTIWPNRTNANTTGWENESRGITMSSPSETGTTYEKASTGSVDSTETTTEMVYTSSPWSTDHTDTEYENKTTTAKFTNDAEWVTDYDAVSTTELPTYTPEEEPFQVINSLPGSR